MERLGTTTRAIQLHLTEEIKLTASEYVKLRELMLERNEPQKFKKWHRSKLLTITKPHAK